MGNLGNATADLGQEYFRVAISILAGQIERGVERDARAVGVDDRTGIAVERATGAGCDLADGAVVVQVDFITGVSGNADHVAVGEKRHARAAGAVIAPYSGQVIK